MPLKSFMPLSISTSLRGSDCLALMSLVDARMRAAMRDDVTHASAIDARTLF